MPLLPKLRASALALVFLSPLLFSTSAFAVGDDEVDEIQDCYKLILLLATIGEEGAALLKKTKPLLDKAAKEAKKLEDMVISDATEEEYEAQDKIQSAAFSDWVKAGKALNKKQKLFHKANKKTNKACGLLDD